MLLGGSGVSIGGVRILREGYKTSYPFLRPRIRVITWIWPPHSKSHHQDYYMFSRESL